MVRPTELRGQSRSHLRRHAWFLTVCTLLLLATGTAQSHPHRKSAAGSSVRSTGRGHEEYPRSIAKSNPAEHRFEKVPLNQELDRLEHQNVAHAHTAAAPAGSGVNGRLSNLRSASRADPPINFRYQPPRGGGRASGVSGRRH